MAEREGYLVLEIPLELFELRLPGDAPPDWQIDSCGEGVEDIECHVPRAQHISQNISQLHQSHLEMIDMIRTMVTLRNIRRDQDAVADFNTLLLNVADGAWHMAFMEWCLDNPEWARWLLGIWKRYIAGGRPMPTPSWDNPERLDTLESQLRFFDQIVTLFHAYVVNDFNIIIKTGYPEGVPNT